VGDADNKQRLQIRKGLTMPWNEDVASIAREIGMSTSWIYKAVSGRTIPFIRIGGKLRFNIDEVWSHLANHRPKKRGRPANGGNNA